MRLYRVQGPILNQITDPIFFSGGNMHTNHSKQYGSLFTVLALVVTVLGVPSIPARAGAPALVEPVALYSSSPMDGRDVVFKGGESGPARGISSQQSIASNLTVNRTGAGTGMVTSSPAGITCGSTCSYAFLNNTVVGLTASPSAGSTFNGWSGSGCSGTGTCTVTVTADTSVSANFALGTSYTLSVSKTGAGSGMVTSSPAGITCGSACSSAFSNNTVVALTEAPSTGSTFTGWSGSECSGTGTCTVIMDSPKSVTANFTLGTYRIYLPLVIR
jgi:hypothetical protein